MSRSEMQKLFIDSEKNADNYYDEMDSSFFEYRPKKKSSISMIDIWTIANIVFIVFLTLFASSVSQELFIFLLIFEVMLLAIIQFDENIGFCIHYCYQTYMTLFFIILYERPGTFGKEGWIDLGLINKSGAETTVVLYFVTSLTLRWLLSLPVLLKTFKCF